MAKRPRIPKYSLHKSSGRARVILNGRHIFLGKYGSEESLERYNRLVAELASSAAGRTSTAAVAPPCDQVTVAEVLAGNYSPFTFPLTVTVDATAPAAPIHSGAMPKVSSPRSAYQATSARAQACTTSTTTSVQRAGSCSSSSSVHRRRPNRSSDASAPSKESTLS